MSQNNKSIKLSISSNSILRLVLFGAILALIIYLKYILVTILIAFILASFAKYSANLLKSRYNISFNTGVILIYIFLAIIILSSIALLLPLIIKESYGLFQNINLLIQSLESNLALFGISINLESSQISTLFPNLGQLTINLLFWAGSLSTYVILVIVLAFYISLDTTGIYAILNLIIPNSLKNDAPSIIDKLQYHIGKWAFKEAVVALIVGMFTYTMLAIWNINYSALLGLLAGISQLVPLLGPILMMGIIVLYVSIQSPALGFIIFILIILIQLIKQFLILPVIFNSLKPINSLLVVLSLMIGGMIAGPLGILIAMPVVSLSSIIYKDIIEYVNQ